MRLFTGISVEEDAIPNLAQQRSSVKLRWTPAANLHITTKFIGEWPEDRLPELQDALAGVHWPGKLTLHVTGVAFLSRIVLAEIEPAADLMALASATEDALEAVGCVRESRAYRPHITLARVRGSIPAKLRETIASMDHRTAAFEARAFHLYLSRASVYTKLATWS